MSLKESFTIMMLLLCQEGISSTTMVEEHIEQLALYTNIYHLEVVNAQLRNTIEELRGQKQQLEMVLLADPQIKTPAPEKRKHTINPKDKAAQSFYLLHKDDTEIVDIVKSRMEHWKGHLSEKRLYTYMIKLECRSRYESLLE